MHRVRRTYPLPLPTETRGNSGVPDQTVWLDIETTGFSAASCRVTLIGCLRAQQEGRVLSQWFADDGNDEAEVLQSAFAELREVGSVMTYNGRRFDLPFLTRRAQMWSIAPRWPLHHDLLDDVARIDPAKRHFPDHRLQTMMRFAGLSRDDDHDGREMVYAYRRWQTDRRPEDREMILGHNADDLIRLPELAAYVLRMGSMRSSG